MGLFSKLFGASPSDVKRPYDHETPEMQARLCRSDELLAKGKRGKKLTNKELEEYMRLTDEIADEEE